MAKAQPIGHRAVKLLESALLEQVRLSPRAPRAQITEWLGWMKPLLRDFATYYAEQHDQMPDALQAAQGYFGWTRARIAAQAPVILLVAQLVRALVAPAAPAKDPAGAGCDDGSPACRLGLLGGTCALPAPLLTPGTSGPVPQAARFCLVEAAALLPSHDPTRGFSPTPGYPADLQERPYDRDKAEQLKVEQIAENLRPELIFTDAPGAIDGPPVVTAAGLVLGGNGRTMGLKLAYARGSTAAKDYLAQHAERFGFTRDQVRALKHPVLVRVIGAGRDLRTLREYVRLLNVPLTQSLDVRAEAVAEAKRLTDDVLTLFAGAFDDATSLAEFLRGPGAVDLARALRRVNIITDRNANRLLVANRFSDEGVKFVERLLAAAVLPSERLLSLLRSVEREGLARSAPFWLAAAGIAGPSWDVRPALAAAVEDLLDAQSRGYSDPEHFMRQGTLVPGAGLQVASHKPVGPLLLQILWKHHAAPARFARIARAFAARARQNPLGQGALLPGETLDPAQALLLAQLEVEGAKT